MSANPRIKRLTAHPRKSTTQSLHGPRGLPNARDKISAIVKSRPSYTCRSVPQAVKNGAQLEIGGVGGGSMEPGSTDVRSGRTAVCDRAPSAPSTAKWRFRPSKKRHSAIGRSGFAAGWGERPGWIVQTARRLTVGGFWSDTLGFPAVVAGISLLPRMKGYHDVRTQKPHDPGHAARRAG